MARRTRWRASHTPRRPGTRRCAPPAWRPSSKEDTPGTRCRSSPPRKSTAASCPDDTQEDVTATLKNVLADEQVSVTVLGEAQGEPPSPMRPDILTAVSAVTDTLWPGVPAVPMMVMGATDGLYLRAEGIPTYGIQGIFYDRDDIRFHGRDERLKVESFYEGQTFLYELIKRLAAGK